jgi:hypothetical protein
MDVKLNVIKQVAKIIGTLQRKTFDTIGNFSKCGPRKQCTE